MRIAILGAGAAGLCMGIRLKQSGIDSFTIFEKSPRLGGTWLDNSYPGSGCDVPSHLYCFSFAPNPDWSHKFSEQPEIHAYFERCAERFGLRPHLRFGVEIASIHYDEDAALWRLRTRDGEEITANVVINGTGQLNRPAIPPLPGLESFAGTWFHSARWNQDVTWSRRRVAVIGNGASAIQFIPRIAPATQALTVFQRTANWILPRGDRPYSAREKRLFRRFPLLLRLYRAWIYLLLEVRFLGFRRDTAISRKLAQVAGDHMRSLVADESLRRALTPDYQPGCKRILISDDYYQALTRDNVAVVTQDVERIAPDGVITTDGTHHPADTIIFATGFETTSFLAPMEVTGVAGRSLNEAWRDGAEAYLGVAVAGFPNFFMLYGPNTNLGHNSILFMIECQVGYVLQCLAAMRQRRWSALDVRPAAMDAFNRQLQTQLAGTAWAAGCTSWYKTASGKITNNWSGFTVDYWRRTRRPDFEAFDPRT